jgi:hypothetical protein
LAKDLVVAKVRQCIEQESVLLALDLSKHHEVLRGFVEVLATHGPHIVQLGLFRLLGPFKTALHLLDFLGDLVLGVRVLVRLTVELLARGTNLDELKGGSLEVLLKLTHVTALAEEGFGGGAELVFEDLLAL